MLFVSVTDTVIVAPTPSEPEASVSVSDLADLIRDAIPGASNRAIAARVGVSPETINRVMRGEGAPDVETVDKIAHALGINVEKAREAAALPRGHREAYQPPVEANLLDDRQRRAIDELIRSIVRTQGAQGDQDRAGVQTGKVSRLIPRDPGLSLDTSPDVETLNPDDEVTEEEFQTAARTVPGKPREQIEYEEHSAAGEESQDPPTT